MDLEVIDLNEENPEVTVCPQNANRKSVVSGLPKEFENGNDSVSKWLENIINEYNNENIKLYEKELIRDKNQMSIKSVRDLEDGFVIGLAVRVSYDLSCATNHVTILICFPSIIAQIYFHLIICHDRSTKGKNSPTGNF